MQQVSELIEKAEEVKKLSSALLKQDISPITAESLISFEWMIDKKLQELKNIIFTYGV